MSKKEDGTRQGKKSKQGRKKKAAEGKNESRWMKKTVQMQQTDPDRNETTSTSETFRVNEKDRTAETTDTDLTIGLTAGQLGTLLYGGKLDMPFSRDLLVMNCHVAGPSHIEGIDEILKVLEPGTRLKLVREPDNEFDDMAVLVLWDKRKIGYLPRRNNEVIARLMDYGKYFYAVVSWVEKYMPDIPDRLEINGYGRYLERAIRVDVYMQD